MKRRTVKAGDKLLVLDTPKVMAILNLTPDSFYEGSRVRASDELLNRASKCIEDGAAILDLGAQSTRPGADFLPADEEWKRLEEPLRMVLKNFPQIVVSIDTFHASVAQKALDAGAHWINDVSGGTLDPTMFETVARHRAPYILMHMRGTPATMKQHTDYRDLVSDVILELSLGMEKLLSLGADDIMIDPGFGFAKNIDQNFALLRELEKFSVFERPVVVGLSRKSTVYKTLDTTPQEALNGTTVLHTLAIERGADILRVHDVKEAVEVIKLLGKSGA